MGMVEREDRDGVGILRFKDIQFLDEIAYQNLQQALDEIWRGPDAAKIIINMDGVRLVSTSVWGKLFVVSQRSKKESRRVALCGLGTLLRDAVRMLKLDKYLEIFEKEDDAVKAMAG
ncbi:MAG TPA: STAS domain-containing protein [Candidatus Brocadiia bacterium]|nr:STAS domain-containing protein [Candidatus Brocadiia bacterium]